LKAGIPVIFMHRDTSRTPFGLDLSGGQRKFYSKYNLYNDKGLDKLKSALEDYEKFASKKSPSSGLLFEWRFNNIHEYLRDFELISKSLNEVASVTISAAWVSDLFIAEDKLTEA